MTKPATKPATKPEPKTTTHRMSLQEISQKIKEMKPDDYFEVGTQLEAVYANRGWRFLFDMKQVKFKVTTRKSLKGGWRVTAMD